MPASTEAVTSGEVLPLHQELPYETLVADTALSRCIHYRLRYDVFCLDTGFEDPGHFPTGEETDEFDEHAVHFLVRCSVTGEWVAAARLITRGAGVLPVEDHCNIDPSRFGAFGPPGGEISRLLLKPGVGSVVRPLTLMEGAGLDKLPPKTDFMGSRTEIVRRLLLGVFTYARDLGMYDVGFFVTAALRRVLERIGQPCLQIGEPCQHRGLRTPYRSVVADAIEGFYARGPMVSGICEVRTPYLRFSELCLPTAEAIPLAPLAAGSEARNPPCCHPS